MVFNSSSANLQTFSYTSKKNGIFLVLHKNTPPSYQRAENANILYMGTCFSLMKIVHCKWYMVHDMVCEKCCTIVPLYQNFKGLKCKAAKSQSFFLNTDYTDLRDFFARLNKLRKCLAYARD